MHSKPSKGPHSPAETPSPSAEALGPQRVAVSAARRASEALPLEQQMLSGLGTATLSRPASLARWRSPLASALGVPNTPDESPMNPQNPASVKAAE